MGRDFEMDNQITVSVAEAARLMGISRPTMYNIIKRTDFDAAFKIGTRTLIHRERLERWAARQAEVNR